MRHFGLQKELPNSRFVVLFERENRCGGSPSDPPVQRSRTTCRQRFPRGTLAVPGGVAPQLRAAKGLIKPTRAEATFFGVSESAGLARRMIPIVSPRMRSRCNPIRRRGFLTPFTGQCLSPSSAKGLGNTLLLIDHPPLRGWETPSPY